MKRVEYFNTKEELERYYENGVPSTVLAIVQPDAETAAVLYTSSNNSPVNPGQSEEQGGETEIPNDPYWGEKIDIYNAIADDKFPIDGTGDAIWTSIDSDFNTNLDKEGIIDVSWNWNYNYNDRDYTIKVVVTTDNDINGNSTGILNNCDVIDEMIDEHSDLLGNVYPTVTDYIMTKSSDPKKDGYDYMIEGNLWAWNASNNASDVETIEENGFYPNSSGAIGFNVNVAGADGTLLTEVFGADENDESVHESFINKNNTDYFLYSFDCTWDGEKWRGSKSNAGFALVGRMGSATQYDYDDQTGEMIRNNSYTAIQMHIANGALYLGDVFAETGESLSDRHGEYSIAVDMWPNTKFYNNGFGAGPENLDMTGWKSGTLTFTLIVPKNLAVNYDTGYDYIGDGEVREIVHPCVQLYWTWNGVPDQR